MDVVTNWPDAVKKNRPLQNVMVGDAVFTYPDPVVWPVTKDGVKLHLQMDTTFTEQDNLIDDFIESCTGLFQDILGISMVARTVEVVIKNELGDMELPYGWHGTVNSAKDINGTTIDAANYVIVGADNTFKTLQSRYDWVRLNYEAVAYVPAGLKLMLLKEIAYQFVHRGDEDIDFATIHTKGALSYRRGSWLL